MSERFRQWYAVLDRRGPVRRGVVLALVVMVGGGGGIAWYLRPDPRRAAAEQAIQQHDYDKAYTLLEECLSRHPQDARLLFLTARTARRAGRYEQAEKHLRACRRLQGETEAIVLEHTLLRAQRGDTEAEAYLTKRVAAGDPDTLLILEVLIQLYLNNYQLFKARDCLDLYLERRPNDVQALMGRGYIWERLFHYANAADDYRRAVQEEPENERARSRLAETLGILGPPEEAAQQFEQLRQRHPDSFPARLGLARAWRQMGQIEAARQLLDSLLSEQPRHPGALLERGRIALEEGEVQRATDWLRQAAALAPSDRETLYNLSRCLQRSGQDAEARACQARFERADADLKRLAQLTKDVLREPHNPALRCEAGMLFLRNGEEEEGVRWLQVLLREFPGYRPAHEALADYYQRIGKPDLAAPYRRVVEAGKQRAADSHRERGKAP